MSEKPQWVALTSTTPNEWTAKSWEQILRLGHKPLLITSTQKRADLQRLLRDPKVRSKPSAVLYVEQFEYPMAAAEELKRNLRRDHITLANWINVPDQATDTFLYTTKYLGLEFPFRTAYSRCRVKPVMRTLLRDRLKSAIDFEIRDVNTVGKLAKQSMQYVCKPITGYGSNLVRIVSTDADLAQYARDFPKTEGEAYLIEGYSPSRNFLTEEFLKGIEVEIDGFAHKGEVFVCALGYKHHEYRPEGFREVAGFTYWPMGCDVRASADARMLSWVREVIRAIEFVDGCFHIEAMEFGSEFEIIEINPRPGGSCVQPIVQKLSGVALGDECIRLWLGASPEHCPEKQCTNSIFYTVVYPKVPGFLRYIHPETKLEMTLGGDRHVAVSWYPIAEVEQQLTLDKEEYLGEAHVEDMFVSHEDLAKVGEEILRQLEQLDYWVVSP